MFFSSSVFEIVYVYKSPQYKELLEYSQWTQNIVFIIHTCRQVLKERKEFFKQRLGVLRYARKEVKLWFTLINQESII